MLSVTDWVRVAEIAEELDLSPLRRRLGMAGIEHRITQESGQQVLWVAEGAAMDEVISILRGVSYQLPLKGGRQWPGQWPGLAEQCRRTPVLIASLVLSVFGALLVYWRFDWVHWLTFQDFVLLSPREISFGSVEEALAKGQYWRLVTPVFLHFGLFHIAFNGMWLWEFGRRIEAFAGSLHLALVMLFSAVVSNWCQYVWEGPSLFGGMSGVLYSLLGYLWIRNWIAPNRALALPRGIIGFMLAWLVICLTGLVDLIMRGSIANAAHVSGLVIGMVLGAVFGIAGARQAAD
ncbi:MAG: rhomboid family intramembrane serine protease [Porticoccaceae bacterium]|nr:rhomboid family intramembrane serine protease [Porticoccaceae bacterium]